MPLRTQKILLQLHEGFLWVKDLRHTAHLQSTLFSNRVYFSGFVQGRFKKIRWQYPNTQIKAMFISQGAEVGEMLNFCWLLSFTSVSMWGGKPARFPFTELSTCGLCSYGQFKTGGLKRRAVLSEEHLFGSGKKAELGGVSWSAL